MRDASPFPSPDSPTPSANRREVLQAGLAVSLGAVLGSSGVARAAEGSDLDARLLPGFKVQKVEVTGATLHAVIGGKGPPLLLIHGAPLTHLSWFRVAPPRSR